MYVYKLHWLRLRDTFGREDKWSAARKTVGAIWDAHGYIWHGNYRYFSVLQTLSLLIGYEVKGIENIPENDQALIVYYHGAIPIDLYYFITKVYLYRNRLIHTVADYFLFKIPGTFFLFEFKCGLDDL